MSAKALCVDECAFAMAVEKALIAEPALPDLLRRFQGITDPDKRREFYWENQALHGVYSEVNFHPRPARAAKSKVTYGN